MKLDLDDDNNRKDIKKQHEFLNRVLETIPSGVVLSDNNGIITYINPIIEKIVGYTKEEILGKNVNDPLWGTKNILGSDIPEPNKAYREVMEQKIQINNYNRMMRRKDGTILYISANGAPIRNNDGEIIGTVFSFADVTEKRQIEKINLGFHSLLLHLSTITSLKNAFDSTLDTLIDISQTDSAGFYLFDSVTQDFNLVSWKNLSKTFIDLVRIVRYNSIQWKIVMEKKPIYFLDKKSLILNDPVSKNEGLECLLVLPIVYEDRVIGIINLASHHEIQITSIIKVMLESITTQIGQVIIRIQTENSLKISTQRYKKLFSEMNIGFVYLENIQDSTGKVKDSRIIEINPALEIIFGMKITDFLNKTIFEVFPKFDFKWFEKISNVGITGEHFETEIFAPIFGKSLEIIAFSPKIGEYALLIQDISEKKKIYTELQKIQKLESLGLLAGGIAHDFNNILTGIMGNLSLAKFSPDLTSELLELLNEAEKATLRAKELTQQLLTFAKGGEPIKKLTTLQAILQDSVDFILRGSNVKPNYTFIQDLWSLEIDEGQISRVIQNIVLNAKEAMPNGGSINIIAENIIVKKNPTLPIASGNYIRVVIQDFGIGILKFPHLKDDL